MKTIVLTYNTVNNATNAAKKKVYVKHTQYKFSSCLPYKMVSRTEILEVPDLRSVTIYA